MVLRAVPPYGARPGFLLRYDSRDSYPSYFSCYSYFSYYRYRSWFGCRDRKRRGCVRIADTPSRLFIRALTASERS